MNNAHRLLERQAVWQKTRACLSWPEKIHQAELLRDTLAKLRRARPGQLKNNGSLPIRKRAP